MSATDRTAADFEATAVAHVHFRVRCETLGHGEEVYLVPDGGGMAKVGFSGYLHSCRHVAVASKSVWRTRGKRQIDFVNKNASF